MNELLDNGFKDDWKWIIGERGELLWHDKPELGFIDAMNESRDDADQHGGAFGTIAIFWLFIIYYVFKACAKGEVLLGFVIGIFGLVIPFVGDLLFYYKTSKTEYVISQRAIFFKFFNGWKYTVHSIPMEDIISVKLVGNNDQRGTLHIITEEQVDFRTYDTRTRKRRDHPTLEFVRNSELALEIINNRIKNNPPRTLKYKAPVLSDWGLQVLQFLMLGSIGLYLYIGIRFYFIPVFEDFNSPISSSIYFYLVCLIVLILSFIRTFKNKELKTDVAYPIIALNLWLAIISVLLYAFLIKG